MRLRVLVVAGWLVAGCGRPQAPAPAHEAVSSAPPDTMVLRAGRHQIWLAEGRAAADSSGQACYERSVEVRTDASRTKVPLLYVLEAPTILNREHVRAVLSYRCRPLAVYRVELATGRPFKIEDR